MNLNETIKKIYLESSDENFQHIIEKMKLKAEKGLLENSIDDIDKAVSELYDHEEEIDNIVNEVDILLENYKEE